MKLETPKRRRDFRMAWACLFLLTGCATDKGVEPRNAQFDFSAVPPAEGNSFITHFESDTLAWRIDKAYACMGEIGIHWSRVLAKVAHDIPGGKPSPKIYDYFAVNLLASQKLATLTVDQALYDHVHMILRNADSDTIKNLSAAPELTGHSLYLAGQVSHAGRDYPFRAEFDSSYLENGLGDVLFELEVRADQYFDLKLFPKFSTWFQDVIWSDIRDLPLNADSLVFRLDGMGSAVAGKLQNRFTADDAFDLDVTTHAANE